MAAEWNACEVCSRRASTPRSESRASTSSTSTGAPLTTQCAPLFTAASAEPRRQERERLGLRQRHRQHGAGGKLLHQPPAHGHQPQRVLERKDARQARGHVLADAVPQHGVRLHPPAHPQLRQGVLDGEQRRLGERRLPQPRAPRRHRRPARERARRAGPSPAPAPAAARTVHRVAEGGLVLVQLARHPRVLRPLAGKEEGDLRRAVAHRPGGAPAAALRERLARLGGAARHGGPAVTAVPRGLPAA